ncbi:hypothetical protein QA802_39105 [Streptomyces sp. B21-105]|uniref:hypothetical protein n=1 Tax=Streptomyces sp. B21-105 TaxID=3039417 RepID=UPI002FF1EB15
MPFPWRHGFADPTQENDFVSLEGRVHHRQSGGKPQLVLAALQFRRPTKIDTIDTGSLRGDLYPLAAWPTTGRSRVASHCDSASATRSTTIPNSAAPWER